MSAINVQANRAEFRRYLTYLETLAPRFPANALHYRRSFGRRLMDVAIRGFLVWYTVILAVLSILMMRWC
jgi:hypothetical protein